MTFDTLGLSPALLSALTEAGFSAPTSVQAAAIPQALAGHDLMVSAQTGSGKTAAFMLPALERVVGKPTNQGRGVQILVLAPTRELALQVNEATQIYGKNIPGLRTTTAVGGMPYGAQLRALSRRVDVLVATPGRLIDHLKSRRVDLSTVHTLVLDEADRMLDMGFIEDIETIVAATPASRQTLLFSATLDGSVARLAERMMREPKRIDISGHRDKHQNITQTLLYADDAAHKLRLLDHMLRDTALDQAIIFTATKRGADDLADVLSNDGFSAAALHGDMNQRQRTRTLSMLQRGQLQILVATDVAARGIDVQGISHAFNFDLPMQAEDYVHRIGRTGRAGRDGQAFTLATHSERHKIRRIEHYIGQTLDVGEIPGLEPQRRARPAGGPKGRPGSRPGGRRPGESRPSFSQGKYGKSPSRFGNNADGAERSERPAFDRGERPARPEFADRGDRPARPERFSRPERSERPGFDRGDRPARPAFADRSDRSARPERSERPGFDRGERPARAEFGDRAPRARREGGEAHAGKPYVKTAGAGRTQGQGDKRREFAPRGDFRR
ncbi:MAG: ATP-dependent RNA helicase DeaD [Kerstersia gyiorum]|uniref:DEAD/DEAH box helicase n=1 Tax=Kerstersia gyiorum TaxID=206506 RepID=UPI0030D4EE13